MEPTQMTDPTPTADRNAQRGYLYPVDKKSDRSPDFRGKGQFSGHEMLVSAWWRETAGVQGLSLSLTDPATLPPKGAPAGAAPVRSSAEDRGQMAPMANKQRPTEPDFKGECSYKGTKIALAGWWKDKEGGVRFISLAFSDPNQRTPAARPASAPPASAAAPSPAPRTSYPSPVSTPANDGLDGLDLGDIFSSNS